MSGQREVANQALLGKFKAFSKVPACLPEMEEDSASNEDLRCDAFLDAVRGQAEWLDEEEEYETKIIANRGASEPACRKQSGESGKTQASVAGGRGERVDVGGDGWGDCWCWSWEVPGQDG